MDKIVILDFGSQFAHLLANRVRRLGVYSEILDAETPASQLKNYKGIIISGGPSSVNDPSSPQIDPAIYDLGIPILGVCYGHHITMHTLGGSVQKGSVGEYGLQNSKSLPPPQFFPNSSQKHTRSTHPTSTQSPHFQKASYLWAQPKTTLFLQPQMKNVRSIQSNSIQKLHTLNVE